MTPAEAAQAAAEAVRALNHATFDGTGYEYPSEVYDVVGALATALTRLPQALRQAGTWLEREHEAGRVGHDRDGRFTAAEDHGALACLDEALSLIKAAARALDEAHTYTAPLTGTGR